jgi:hypothetical protein
VFVILLIEGAKRIVESKRGTRGAIQGSALFGGRPLLELSFPYPNCLHGATDRITKSFA